MTVGENIRRIRKEKGYTQKQLADKCKMYESQIRKYELGKANPKLETIDKIANALGVAITKIKEDISWNEFLNTSSAQSGIREGNAMEGVVAILAHIYGNAEEKSVFNKNGECPYWLVGTGNNTFVLYEEHIQQLLEYFKTSTPFIIENMKDTRPEGEIIKEILADLNSPEHIALLRKFEKENDLIE